MAMMLLGAAQFLIGGAIAAWGVGHLDRQDVLLRFQPTTKLEKIRIWAVTLAGFAIAAASPITVMMG